MQCSKLSNRQSTVRSPLLLRRSLGRRRLRGLLSRVLLISVCGNRHRVALQDDLAQILPRDLGREATLPPGMEFAYPAGAVVRHTQPAGVGNPRVRMPAAAGTCSGRKVQAGPRRTASAVGRMRRLLFGERIRPGHRSPQSWGQYRKLCLRGSVGRRTWL